MRVALEEAVKRQMMSDVPYGVLLSGGLDSSIISAVTQKYAQNRIESGSREAAWWPRLHSFAVGLHSSPDLEKARLVARHIGTVHHEINYTIQEGLDALSDVVYFTETYDVTTIRASTPMYLLARVIKSMGIKMVLSGEGADEIFGGYLYFHKAPDARAFHEETVRKLSAPEPGSQDVPRHHDRKANPPRGLRPPAAGRRGMAAERAILRRSRLFVDRHPEAHHRRERER